jgi:hypothetical protein
LSWVATPEHLLHGRCQAGDRHLNFHDERDILVSRVAEVLAHLEDPAGHRATVACTHPSCYQTTSAIGLQAWLISTRDWMPVRDVGSLRWAAPYRAWYGVPKSGLVLPKVQLEDAVAERLDCVPFGKPSAEAVESVLRSLSRRYGDLAATDQEVISTADLLLDRLEVALHSTPETRERVPLPAISDGRRSWATRPLVPDVEGVENLAGLTLLPPGAWPTLRSAYELQRASDVVTWEIRVTNSDGADLIFDDRTRAELVALLTRRSDRSSVARLVGRLAEQPVGSVYLDLRAKGQRARTKPLSFFLSRKADVESGNVMGGTLFTTPSVHVDFYSLAAELGDYLGIGQTDLIHSYFTARQHVLKRERIDEARVEEARTALETVPYEDLQPMNVVSDPTQLVIIPEVEREASPEDEPRGDEDVDEPAEFSSPWPTGPSEQRQPSAISGRGPTRTAGASNEWTFTDGSDDVGSRGSSGRSSSSGAPAVSSWTTHDGGCVTFTQVAPRPAPYGSYTPEMLKRQPSPTRTEEALADAIEEVDDRAMRLVQAYGESMGARVERVDREYRGWDLEFHFEHETWPVEVKGMAQESRGFVVTRNELRAARTEPEYRFIVVTGLRAGHGLLTVVRATNEQLDPARLEALSWLMTPWRSLLISNDNYW